MILRHAGYIAGAITLSALLARTGRAQDDGPRFVNPPSLSAPTGYTHVVVGADGRTVYIAGQVARDSAGRLVGGSDFAAQANQVYINLQHALASVGGTMSDLVKTTTLVADAKDVATLREVRARYLDTVHPPANTVIVTAGFAGPGLLIEIEGVAVLRKPYRP